MATPCSWARSMRTLIAIDARNGQPLWKTTVADSKLAYSVTMAPLVIKDLVHRRHGRRRVRHPRFHRRVRRAHGPGGLALQRDPGSRRARQRDVERRRLGARRRLGLDHGLVRSRAESDVLGHRQPGPRLEPRPAARRQPVLGLGRRARRRHRRAQVALPVHAERRLRLRRRAGPRARRHAVARRSRAS